MVQITNHCIPSRSIDIPYNLLSSPPVILTKQIYTNILEVPSHSHIYPGYRSVPSQSTIISSLANKTYIKYRSPLLPTRHTRHCQHNSIYQLDIHCHQYRIIFSSRILCSSTLPNRTGHIYHIYCCILPTRHKSNI